MRFDELKSRTELSRYVESYWYFGSGQQSGLTLIPDGTFNVLVAKSSFYKTGCKTAYPAGNYLIPITNQVVQVQSKKEIFGIRFKAFSLSNIVGKKISRLQIVNRLSDCVEKPLHFPNLVNFLDEQNEFSESRYHLENLAFDLLNHRFSLNENLRYKVNYILNRKGDIRIDNLCAELGISRQALHKSFKDSLGIGPKDLAMIWRLNHYFTLMDKNSNLTETAIDAGFYDQAHSINAFKSQWASSPLQLKKTNSELFQFSCATMNKRFNNYYDPEL